VLDLSPLPCLSNFEDEQRRDQLAGRTESIVAAAAIRRWLAEAAAQKRHRPS
jgi:hypothetical protein